MRNYSVIKKYLQLSIDYLFILLFVYAAVSKLLDFQNFQAQLGQSPLLSLYAVFVSFAVPTLEIILSILLSFSKTRLLGLIGSTLLMVMFTTYIVIILNFSSFIPCSCGGILEKLGWTEHLIFNALFILLGTIAILITAPKIRMAVNLASGGIISAIIIIILFISSEDIIQNENPFIRRFPTAAAAKVAGIDLQNSNHYVAGAANGLIYLGNEKAPLQIVVFDTNLKKRKQFTIKLEREDFNFRALTVKIQGNNFYIYDGSVPVIFKGLVKDWLAKVISVREFGFNDILFPTAQHTIIRGQEPRSNNNILALVDKTKGIRFTINKSLLQKQIDGFFDTDGTMQYSVELQRMIYTYYYRNEYIVSDSQLQLIHRGKTIDTTSRANIKVVKLQKSGDSKMAAPPYMVNKRTAVSNNLLMVNSMLRGKFEQKDAWKAATAVDVYDFTTQKYLLSFYVHDENGFAMKNCFATNEAMYIVSGHYLLKYGFGEIIKSKFTHKNLPAGNRNVDRKPV